MDTIYNTAIKIENLLENTEPSEIVIEPSICFIKQETSDSFLDDDEQLSDSCVKKILNATEPVYMLTPKVEIETSSDGKNTKGPKNFIKCRLCPATFKKERYYKAHVLKHSNTQKIECNVCYKSFPYNSFLKHIMVHTGERPHVCEICGRGFRLNRDLKQHSFTHTGEKPYPCAMCGKPFADASARRKHYQTHTGEKPYSCELCQRCFTQISHLREHQVTHTKEKVHKCNICRKNFTTKSSMQRHVLTHANCCDICGESFTTNSRLERHKKMHSMDRPYSCPHCTKRFLSKADANAHLLIHTDEKNVICGICEMSFKSSRYLRVHHYNYHNRMELPFVCEICNKGFYQEAGLKRHSVVHVHKPRVKCPECNRTFSSCAFLEKHACEGNQMYFNCEKCDKRYRHKSDLAKHARKLHFQKIKVEKLD